ncbi:MAG TPA: arylamine N-acetyltransferase [Lacunisphaera sp.]|jgi:N-hydroxyarylamine O-acetyltransferase|nr:arylamine N-acetyltransferase [Lacunisphaera sp.]
MSDLAPDLDAYCARIGYAGPREPTLALLHALTLHHATSIPFENLDVLLGRPIRLEPAALFRKLVVDRRGGYCFEQNNLFLLILRALGFRVTPIGARVRFQIPREVMPARTHLFLRVHLSDGDWLTDVGLGGTSLTGAIPLEFDREHPTPHETRRLVREDGRMFHQFWTGTEWADLCEFTFDTMHPIDCELANWWTSASPASHFKTGVIVGRAGRDGTRKGIRAGQFTHRRGPDVLQQIPVTSDNLPALLAEHFDLHLPAGLRLEPVAGR